MSRYAGRPVRAGEFVTVIPEYVLFCEMQWHHSIERAFQELNPSRIWDPARVVVIPDHRIPANIPFFADVLRTVREFVERYGVTQFYDVGRGGIRNQVFLEEGFAWPGALILTDEPNINSSFGMVGALGFGESVKIIEALAIGETWFRAPETVRVTLTGTLAPGVMTRDVSLFLSKRLGQDGAEAKMVEFDGDAIGPMSLDERNTLCQQTPLTIGALSSLMVPDQVALDYVRPRARKKEFEVVRPDTDARYAASHRFDVSAIAPHVSPPPMSSTAVPVTEVLGTPIQQAYIGSCSSARLNDLRIAAKILKGRRVHAGTRMIAVPISQRVMLDAMAEGIIQTLIEAGVQVAAPSCGACPGGHAGVIGAGENCITTTSHNYPGRMGSDKAKIFLASPATVAASTIEGRIADPRAYV
jgi:3-isopropylmalate/(R)-2-methylmalate dehydratase large subunit